MPLGSFATDAQGHGHFVYGQRYLERADAFSIDPIHLPLAASQYRIPRRQDGHYGALSDAGPNAWGIKVTASIRHFQKQVLPVTAVDRLLDAWHFGSGCLGFSPSPDMPPDPGAKALPVSELNHRVVKRIEQLSLQSDATLDPELVRILFPGSSLGGVRPKTVVEHEGAQWIAKFSRPDDRFDVPAAEYATLRLAHQAGITVPDFELVRIGDRYVLIVGKR